MDTVEQAIEYLRHNNTPYWWIKSGNNKIGDNTDESDINSSIEQFRKTVQFLPAGSYKMECSRNPKDRSGSYLFPFTKGQTSQQTNHSMQSVNSTNAYGVADHVYKQIVEEARKTMMFEQMYDKFGPLVDLVKDLEKRVLKLEKMFADEDEDGMPDFLQVAQKASDTVQAASEIKKVFSGGNGFRL
ncbi:hypothetical protein GCM10028806_19580 [Spirosoma terrae]|uniref:Uncharacterized protein n=1 Tax=Spirosoma terrae TaxID=1968276 RepID=A0A6L9L2G0_9BACT|nr:hypothetical protein [Spirosoma terrae]NDU94725.1 hypothetical protein [Spirosoma terrae]